MRRRFFNKIGGGYLPTDNFIVFDKSVSDPANITISEEFFARALWEEERFLYVG